MSDQNAMLIDFRYFFGCPQLCLINNEGVDAKNVYTKGAIVKSSCAGDACIKSDLIKVTFVKSIYYIGGISIKDVGIKKDYI